MLQVDSTCLVANYSQTDIHKFEFLQFMKAESSSLIPRKNAAKSKLRNFSC